MKVYKAKDLNIVPMYGEVPDLTQGSPDVVEYFDISDEECCDIDCLFIDPTNYICGASLDLGDYQYYNTAQCAKMLEWLEGAILDEKNASLNEFFLKLKNYLRYAIDNETGIAIEL